MRPIATNQNGRSFGTFTGVFVPTTLTILGAIMYLRLGWVVGNAVLVGYQLARNWNGRLNLCMVVPTEETSEIAVDFLKELKSFARLPAETGIKVFTGEFWESLPQAPAADLSILGLQSHPDLDFVEKAVKIIDASCIFVRDSGDESALA